MKYFNQNTKILSKSYLTNVAYIHSFVLVANAVKKSSFSTAKTAAAKNNPGKKTERGLVFTLKDGIVTNLHLKKLKTGKIEWIQGRSGRDETTIPFISETNIVIITVGLIALNRSMRWYISMGKGEKINSKFNKDFIINFKVSKNTAQN